MPQETETVIDPPASERVNNKLEDLFKDAPEVVAEEKEEVVEEKPQEEEKPEPEKKSEEKKEETTESEDEEIDWDNLEVEPEVKESKAIEQAKIQGRKAKELSTKLTEREVELERVAKERDDAKARLDEIEATKIDPKDHPDFKELLGEANEYINTTADTIPGDSTAYVKNFGRLIGSYMELPERGAGREEAMAKFKSFVVDTLKLSETPYDELEDDEKRLHEKDIKDVIKAIQGNVGRTKKLTKLHDELTEKSKTGHLAVGVRAYESTSQEFKQAFDVVGDLPDDAIEASPYAISSIVAKMVKENPEMEKRLLAAKKEAVEFAAGPKVYTQAEIDKLQANGINIKEHNAERLRLHKEKVKKDGVMLIEAKMIRADYIRVKKELDALKAEKDAEESESDALIETTRKKAPKKEIEKYVPPSERPLAIDRYLD